MSLIDEYKEEEQNLKKASIAVWGYSLMATICMLAMPIFMFQVYDRILKSRNVETLIAMLIFALIVLVCYGIFDSVRTRVLTRAAVQMETRLAGVLMAGELSRQSDPSTQSLRDLSTLRQLFSSNAATAIFDLPMLPLFLLILFYIHVALGIVTLVGVLVIIGVGILGDRATAYENSEHLKAAIKSSKTLEMHMNAQELVRAQGLYRESVRDWGAAHSEQLQRFIASTSVTAKSSAASKALRQIVQVLLIASGAMLVLAEQASGAVVFAAAMIGGRALAPVDQIVLSWRQIKQGWETRQRLIARLGEMSLPVDRTKLPAPKGFIGLDRVAYLPQPGAAPIIRGVSAQIEAGDSVAIIGPSGAGKSTLARLIVGYLLPNAGMITLDGQDIKEWDPTARGLHIGYMPQQITFFDATVRENIARLRKDDPEEWAVEAAKRAGVHEIIMKLPQGYDTKIEKGVYMPSGGQSQLIALARAFYGNPKVIVLDEPNAALDQEGEKIFHDTITAARKAGTTTIIVTQRPSVLQYVNKVMLLQNGMVKDYGPKDQVMNSGNVRAVGSTKQSPAQRAAAAKAEAATKQKAADEAPKAQAARKRRISLGKAIARTQSDKKDSAANPGNSSDSKPSQVSKDKKKEA